MKLLFISLFLLFSQATFSQNNEKALNKMSYDELKEAFNLNEGKISLQKEILKVYLNRAKKENNIEKKAIAYYYYTYISTNDKYYAYCDSVIDLTKDKKILNFPMLGFVRKTDQNIIEHKYIEAIDNLLLSEKYALKNNNLDFYFDAKNNIAAIKLFFLGEDREALNGFKESYNHFNNLKTKSIYYTDYYENIIFRIASSYNNLNVLDSALFYNNKGKFETYKSKNNQLYANFIINEASIQIKKKDFEKALDNLNKADSLLNILRADNNTLLYLNFNIAKAFEKRKNLEKAKKYYLKVDSLYIETEIINPNYLDGYKFLINYFHDKKDFENENKYVNKLISIKEIHQNQYKEFYKKIHYEYDVPKLIKEKETLISSLKNNNATKKYTIIGLMIFACLLVYFVLYQFKQRKKDKQNFEILLQQSSKEPDFNIIQTEENSNTIKKLDIAPSVIENILEQLNKFEKEKGFLQNTITINTLAQEFETNTNYLSQIINHYKVTSFTNYLNNLRIDFAVEELKKNKKWQKYAISSIATEVGFNTSESFSSAFFKRTSIKPSYFIKELQKIKS